MTRGLERLLQAGLLFTALFSFPLLGADKALILGSTVTGGASSVEALEALALGLTVEVATDAQWTAKTTADFASYRVLILGDATCSTLTSGAVAAAANAATWSSAVNGNVIINGSDPVFHKFLPGALALTNKGVDFAAAQVGKTGAYISLSCYYDGSLPGTAVPLLNGFGSFTVGDAPGCFNDVHVVATHPAISGLTDASLSNWNCSVHEIYYRWPADFEVLAIARNAGSSYTASDGTVGSPYILARGVTVVSDILLTPVSATLPARASQVMTATVKILGIPVAGATVTFTVAAGPDAGSLGTAVTDSSGVATKVLSNSGLAGVDVVRASFVDSGGRTQTSGAASITFAGLAPLSFVSIGRSQPAAQQLTIPGLAAPVVATSSPQWLAVAIVPPGTTSHRIEVSVLPAAVSTLAFGTYAGTVTVGRASTLSSGGKVTAFGTYTSSGTAADGDGAVTIPATLEMRPAPTITISATCPGNVAAGQQLNIPISVSGGSGTYSFSYGGPPWLFFQQASASTATVTGAVPGYIPAPFSVRVTDTGGSPPAVFACNLNVPATPAPVTIAPVTVSRAAACPSGDLTVGTLFQQILGATGGDGSYDWSMTGTLPRGLAFGGNLINGIPDAAGAFSYTVRASSGSSSATMTCSITVQPAPVRITSACPGSAEQGASFNHTVQATGGAGSGTYQVSVTGLPTGLSASNNAITGTATAQPGTYSVSIQVTSGGFTSQVTCTMSVARSSTNPLELTGSCPAPVQTGTPVSIPLKAAGGGGSYSYSMAPVAGLSISPAGVVSGTLNDPGDYPITVTVRDGIGVSETWTCSIRVVLPPLVLEAPSCPAPILLGESINVPLSVRGGRGPYTWTLSDNPAWLSLSSTTGARVTLAGTPERPGQYGFRVQVTGVEGSNTATFQCTISVNSLPLQITGSGCPATPLTRTTAVSVTATGSGGRAPYSWTLTGPTWLSLSAGEGSSTNISGVPPASGSFNFSVAMYDSISSSPVSYTCPFTVAPLVVPTAQIAGLTAQANAAQTDLLELRLSAALPVATRARIVLTFTPDVALTGVTDNQLVQFSPAATPADRRAITIDIPAGTQTVPLGVRVTLSNVAGTVRVQLQSIIEGTQELLTSAPAPAEWPLRRQAPVVSRVSFTGSEVLIEGYSNSLDMQSITLTFAAAQDVEIEGGTTFSFADPVRTLFADRYRARVTNGVLTDAAGSTFQIRFPVSIEGEATALTSVSISVTNAAGTTQSGPHSRQ